MMQRADYLQSLQALLPPGDVWPREPDAVLTRVLDVVAGELARVDLRGDELSAEADPRRTAELLAEWELDAGLPDPCITAPQGLELRQERLVSKLTSGGGASRQYFIGLAAGLGYAITIHEYRPFTCQSPCNAPLDPDPWRHAWRVDTESDGLRVMTCQSGCNEPLRSWGHELLECVLTQAAPAQTVVLFGYREPSESLAGALLIGEGEALLIDGSDMLITG